MQSSDFVNMKYDILSILLFKRGVKRFRCSSAKKPFFLNIRGFSPEKEKMF